MKAVWNSAVLAESDATRVIDGNHYFPPESVHREYFSESETRTRCCWKGEASYYHVHVAGQVHPDAAWTYLAPLPVVEDIAGYVSFGDGVQVTF